MNQTLDFAIYIPTKFMMQQLVWIMRLKPKTNEKEVKKADPETDPN